MDTFTLKCIALLLMVIDHIGFYFDSSPFWFRWIGRLSFPLFLFCMVWGYHYTHDRKVYLLRMYLCGIFMAIWELVIDAHISSRTGYGNHNIFVTMLITCVLISVIELIQKRQKFALVLIAGIFFEQILYYVVSSYTPLGRNLSGDTLTAFLPNLVINEYGFEFVVLGILMYFLKENKNSFTAMYLLFCTYLFTNDARELGLFNKDFFDYGFQFLMVFALPLMLAYNNKKGRGMKYFFYVFYPAHTLLLFVLANCVFV